MKKNFMTHKFKRGAVFAALLFAFLMAAALYFAEGNSKSVPGDAAIPETQKIEASTIQDEQGDNEYALETETLSIRTQNGMRHRFQVELASTPLEWKHGLMHRTEMPFDHGMLFVFPEENMRSFWMKNTLIPLDMIFIRADGEIVNIQKNAKPYDLTSRPSTAPALAVLEINGGLSDRLGIAAGDIVYHDVFGNMPDQKEP